MRHAEAPADQETRRRQSLRHAEVPAVQAISEKTKKDSHLILAKPSLLMLKDPSAGMAGGSFSAACSRQKKDI